MLSGTLEMAKGKKPPRLVRPVRLPTPSALDAAEALAEKRRGVMDVALAQPHRRESENPHHGWLSTPLGRFCLATWPADDRLRYLCFGAGNDYAKEIRALQTARGFAAMGGEFEGIHHATDDDLTSDAIRAARSKIKAAERLVASANAVLRGIMPRLPRAMERLCCSLEDPSIYDRDILRAGLWRLAGHYGLLDRGINGTKEF